MANFSFAIRIMPEPLRTLAFGSISGTYAAIGTPLANPARLVKFKNNTDALIIISWDGVNDHMALPAFSGDVEDITSNKTRPEGMYIGEGTQFYVKSSGTSASMGDVFIEVRYGYLGT